MKERFIIIGGVAAGMSAASRARKLRPDMEILVFERTGYVSYAPCGIPYFIAGRVKTIENLVVYDARFFKEKRDIGVFLHHEVRKIFPQKKVVLVRNNDTGEEKEYVYNKLLVSTGARPLIPPIKGMDTRGVFTTRVLEDGSAIKEYIRSMSPRKGLILGAGYIGMEMAEAFAAAGLGVTIVEKMPSILGTMDAEITDVIEETLAANGVTLIKSKGVAEFYSENSILKAGILETGERIEADIALVGAGIRPNVELALDAGIELGNTRAIKVNRMMETSMPHVYAAGDCAETFYLVLGRNAYIPLGATANKQGRVAGENAAGGNAEFGGIVGTAVFKVFDLEVGRTGLTQKEAAGEGIDAVSSMVEHISRAHYYPGAIKIRIKLVSEKKTGRVLGAQLVGKEGVSQRTNVLATAITQKMTAAEVARLDLGYAPPFAPFYDPVLIAAEEMQKQIAAKV